jgi:hypothetical protein
MTHLVCIDWDISYDDVDWSYLNVVHRPTQGIGGDLVGGYSWLLTRLEIVLASPYLVNKG